MRGDTPTNYISRSWPLESKVEIDITGVRELWLSSVVTDGGDGIGCDWGQPGPTDVDWSGRREDAHRA